jgi:uncharacterized membrane protein
MTNKNKIKLLISCLVIVLPSVAALILKELVETKVMGAWHFSWILPVVLVAIHLFLHLVTFNENKRVEQNEKIVNITYWIIPVISVYISALFMALSLGFENVLGIVLCVMFALMFIIMGNYMPKAKQNRYFGMKIKWTLTNEENWNATHRFSGKIWVLSGVVLLLGAFLPEAASIILLLAVSVPAVFAPIIYSYLFYRKQLRDGTATKEDYSTYPKASIDKKITLVASAVGVAVVALVVILMFVGSITFTLESDELEIDTSFGGNISIDYDDIESIEYREENVPGMRVSGFASSKLLYGWFKNDEFGNYTRYTYTGVDAAIIIHADGEIIVIADESVEATRAIYEALCGKGL